MVAAEPLGAFTRDPNDLVLTVGGRLVVNHLLEHDFLSDVQLQSLLDDPDRVPLTEKAPIFNENPPIVGRPQDSGTRRTLYGNYGGANHHKHNPHKLHDLPVLKRVAERVLETAKKSVVAGVGWSRTILDMAEISAYDHTPQHLHHYPTRSHPVSLTRCGRPFIDATFRLHTKISDHPQGPMGQAAGGSPPTDSRKPLEVW